MAESEPLPIVGLSCSLSDPELRKQLGRYRVIGDGAEVLEWTGRRRTIRLAKSVPESLIESVMQVEQECCPFFVLSWDSASRRLSLSVTAIEQEPALDALTHALGLAHPLSDPAHTPP